MDGDLQNEPEDIPRLVAAVEARRRRRERPPRRAQGLVGPDAAVAADQRDAPALHRRRHLRLRLRLQRLPAQRRRADAAGDRQAEVHEGARPLRRRLGRRGRRRPCGARGPIQLLAAAPAPAGAARPRRLLAAADPVDRDRARRHLHAARDRARHLRDLVLDRPLQLPRPAARRRRRALRARDPRLHPRARRGIPRQNPARGRRPASLLDLGGTVEQARSRHRRSRLHLLELHPPPAGAHRPRGRLARRAHLRGQPREPRGRDEPRAALVRARGHPRPGAGREARRRGRRDRQRGGRVARGEVDRGGRVRVRDDERGGDADPARRDPAHAGRALHPDLLERGVRDGGVRADGRGASAQPAFALCGDEGRRRPARVLVLRHLRAADRDRAPVQQLRAAPASRRR